jgi:hypothetical protein
MSPSAFAPALQVGGDAMLKQALAAGVPSDAIQGDFPPYAPAR